MQNIVTCLFLLILQLKLLYADIYLHNPRGSNNRLDESNNQRTTPNRIFDSQNNNRGGYNVGNLYYYTGSELQIEWTNQHSCKSENAHCDIIIQYMCSDTLRDGTDVRQIPQSNANCDNNNCNKDLKYGMHEDFDYFQSCSRRSRNKGLFIADQKLKENAMSTRQNSGATVSGYECTEERDYYPYWHPSPWIDIAVLTNDPSKCKHYKSESENVKSRWYCEVPKAYISETGGLIPNNKEDCEKLVYPASGGTRAVWKENPAHGVDAPVCRETQYTRDNHLGNTFAGNPPVFNWTIPNRPNKNCALRIRYNVSTGEYEGNSTFAGTKVNLFPNLANAEARGFVFKNNPEVKLFEDLDFKLKLNINTDQFGRVFQDRSHRFEIKERPSELKDKIIMNLNVRGKRGNIVQVYPGVEYDFVPNKLETYVGAYVHFQWTGSNKNPQGNDGNGLAGSDRNNIVLLTQRKYDKGSLNSFAPLDVYGAYGTNYPISISNASFLGLSSENLIRLATLKTNNFGGSSGQLDDAGTYFDLGPQVLTQYGVAHYMCTRNNNFSNRDQKGELLCQKYPFVDDMIGTTGGTLKFSEAELTIPENCFEDLTYVRIDAYDHEQVSKKLASSKLSSENLASNYLKITPSDHFSDKDFELKIKLNLLNEKNKNDKVSVYRVSPDGLIMTKLVDDYDASSGYITLKSLKQGGYYVARSESDSSGLIVGLVVGAVAIISVVIALVIYFRRNPKYVRLISERARNAKRSMFSKV